MARTLIPPSHELTVWRNIHLYDNDGAILGGAFQNGSLTQRDLYQMCPVFLDFEPGTQWRISTLGPDASTGDQLADTLGPLPVANYIVLAPDKTGIIVRQNTERHPRRVLTRGHSSNYTPRRAYFCEQVRKRDNACMLSGVVPDPGDFMGFEASHIFPQARLSEWTSRGFQNLITDQSAPHLICSSKIHSPQNGLLLSASLHQLFDSYRIAVDPDNGYRIVNFRHDIWGVDGRTLGFGCRDPSNPNKVSDDLLRWHFRTCILANMRGAAIPPDWDMDFSDGDIIGEIMEGEDAAERLEVEFFTRLMPPEERENEA